jgi:acetyltransferase-like isoleucine patch superfamily enzyme
MPNDDRTKIIPRRTPASAAVVASVKRAMAITSALNHLTFDDAAEIQAMFSDLIGNKVDESFSLIPPFYTTGGENIRVGRNVFINQNCTRYDLGGIGIADDVMIGPNVSIITSGHPIEGRSPEYPCWRKSGVGHSFDWRRLKEHPQAVEIGTSK